MITQEQVDNLRHGQRVELTIESWVGGRKSVHVGTVRDDRPGRDHIELVELEKEPASYSLMSNGMPFDAQYRSLRVLEEPKPPKTGPDFAAIGELLIDLMGQHHGNLMIDLLSGRVSGDFSAPITPEQARLLITATEV